MILSKKQKIVVLSGLVLFVACFAVPPWEAYLDRQHGTSIIFQGYSFYTNPPDGTTKWPVRIDLDRFLIQWVVVVVATIMIVLLLGKSEKRSPD